MWPAPKAAKKKNRAVLSGTPCMTPTSTAVYVFPSMHVGVYTCVCVCVCVCVYKGGNGFYLHIIGELVCLFSFHEMGIVRKVCVCVCVCVCVSMDVCVCVCVCGCV